MKDKVITIDDIDLFVFDFDGVLTDNLVHLDQNSTEWVSCSRADGLAFDVMRKLNKPSCILSTEKNSVVSARANKLKVPVIQGSGDKLESLKLLMKKSKLNKENIMYIGNDINDYKVMQFCGYTVCPSDSHNAIKKISNIVLKTSGGNGVARELLEDVFNLDFIDILYKY